MKTISNFLSFQNLFGSKTLSEFIEFSQIEKVEFFEFDFGTLNGDAQHLHQI